MPPGAQRNRASLGAAGASFRVPGWAALDLGATKLFAAATPVKTAGTSTGELRKIAARPGFTLQLKTM